MKVSSLVFLFSFSLVGCSSTYYEEASFCFASKDEARNVGHFMMDNGFTSRTRFFLDGSAQHIEGLGFSWDGFKSDGSCLEGESQLKLIYEPTQQSAFNRTDVIPAAKLAYNFAFKEYSAL
ncbi:MULTISPECIES: hypothetical protein [unclassified Colwellia]|uniref:hypothetical protein n=1 Tax=unclassified Colwellia TaxID=196834 RepID=UPI0015F53017|nr:MULTISPECIES: hypothetical protein [unclassified Colwellia]MBA6231443.1 hypothetical protein [Colwellia sp. MB02u-7]MBA6235010.1 hypothetical protein [Colwellia sp. MB02u-11]MBA6298746.1 hypothetical protein [Colwellia sp. MB3u-22]MBA6309240.1 hypothetical protein [Colwellia sp. MB3u-64]